ncbi:MAG: Glu/Leu/Phe/Val family dehydrogenase [Polyangiales bacterium]
MHVTADDLGPSSVVLLREPRAGLEAFVVIDNVACGPAIGGVRMATDVGLEEVARLARAMTLKNATAGLPHGGGKAAIVADPSMPKEHKERLVRAFARAIRELVSYIPGPDLGTDETCVGWIHDEIGRAAGLPRVLGGIPLDEIGATGLGLAISAEVAAPFAGMELRGARVVVQGFGAVGRHAARFLKERGARIVAVADSKGVVVDGGGLDLDALFELKRSGRSVTTLPRARTIAGDDLVGVECEIWIPAARPDVLTEANVDRLRARLVLQGANIPATAAAERRMHARGVVSVPDFVANAGGVICAAAEWRGGSQRDALAQLEDLVRRNTREVLERSRTSETPPREAAVKLARTRVLEAMRLRRV